MRSFSLLAILLLSNALRAQSSCEIWQWLGTDSAGKIVANIQTYDTNGNVTYEKLSGYYYWPNPYGGTEGEYFRTYRDTTSLTYCYVSPAGDSSRVVYEYDINGRLTHEVHKRYRHVALDTVQSGMFTINTLAVDTSDNNWTYQYEVNYSYDSAGRKTQMRMSNPDWSGTDYYRWAYDSQGRIVRYEYVFHDKPSFTSEFTYSANTVSAKRTFYDDNGKVVRRPGKKSPPYMQEQVIIEVKDEKGRVIEERKQTRKGKVLERWVTSYNADGKTERETWYDGEGNVILTHVFVYK